MARLPVNNRFRCDVQCEVKLAPKKEHMFTGMCETPAPLERAILITNNSTPTVSLAMALNTCLEIARHVYTSAMTTKQKFFGD